jgi:Tfp pilus assembly protein PilF
MKAQQYERAKTGYQTVIERAPRANAPDVLGQAYGGLAALYQTTGKLTLAEAQYRNAIGTIDREWSKLNSDDWKTTF